VSEKVLEIKVLQRRLVAENLRFEIFFDHIEQADGQQVENFLVVAPRVKTAHLVTGVSVFAIWQNKVCLLRVYRHPLQAECWELPRGFVDAGEAPEMSASRELEEETGLRCRPEDLRSFGLYAPEAGTMAARVHLFAAHNCERKNFIADEFGHRELRFFSMEEIANMIQQGEIEDPGIMLAYYRYRDHG
jgi:ADP-ribose pyrophosphatase YjhB (NUDIX family)